MTLPPRRILLPLAGILAGLALIVGGLLAQSSSQPPISSGIGGPFALTDQNGKAVTEAAFKGRPLLVFFGYTHCPDVCPTTLSDLTQMLKALGPEKDASVLFVTIDPERDTPAVLKDYLSGFDPRITGLTGSPAAIEAMLRGYRVFAKRAPTEGGDYTMDHTSIIYLMDKAGNFVQSFNADLEKPEVAAATFAKLM